MLLDVFHRYSLRHVSNRHRHKKGRYEHAMTIHTYPTYVHLASDYECVKIAQPQKVIV
jgi:hypothetical protein